MRYLVIALLSFITISGLTACSGGSTSTYDKHLQTVADELNKQIPMQVDEMTRLDKVEAKPGRRLIYYYTVTGLGNAKFDPNAVAQVLKASLIENVKTEEAMKNLRDNDAVMTHIYNDSTGRQLVSIDITPRDYK